MTKPVSRLRRPSGWIPLTNYALVDKIPESLVLKDHLMPFEGAKSDPKFLWGLYGTSSMNQVLFLADAYAKRHKKQMLTVQLWYHVDHFELVKSKITPEIADETGFVHLDRLQGHYRDELRELVLLDLHKKTHGAQFAALQNMNLDEIMIRHPEAVNVIFDKNKKVNVVVHPVRQIYDENDKRSVHVATVRNIKARLATVEVRYLEHIKVVL